MALNSTAVANNSIVAMLGQVSEAVTAAAVTSLVTDGNQMGNFSVASTEGQQNEASNGLPGPVQANTLPDVLPGEWQVVLGSHVWTAFQVVHTLLTVGALLANVGSLVVIYGLVPRLTPPLQLLTSLAFADMLAPWAVMTLYFPASACQDEIHSALLITAHNAAALTVLALALCHHVATFRPLNYERILSQKRLWLVINIVWIAALICSHVHFIAVLAHHNPHQPYCLQVLAATDMALTLAFAIAAATVLTTVLVYTRILLHLRPIHQLAAENEPRKSTRGVVTGILLAAAYIIGWTPYLITKLVQVRQSRWLDASILATLGVMQALILVRSIIDPALYGIRMSVMQTGYLSLYHKCRGWAQVGWARIARHAHNDDLPSTPLNPIESIC